MQQLKLLEIQPLAKNYFFELAQHANYADLFGEKIKKYAQETYPFPPKVLSLFSGAGGLDIGFHDAGFDIIEAVEIDQVCANTLHENASKDGYFGTTFKINCADIKEYYPTFEHVDFIIGGPPCQSFSAAGARAEGVAGTKDDRGRLFLEYVRLLQALQPKGFVFENVYRIVGANKGQDWKQIVEAFSNAGYTLYFRILDTADFGVPQHRERLIIVGLRKDVFNGTPFLFPRPTHGQDSFLGIPHYSSQSAISDLPVINGKKLTGKYGHLLAEIPPGLNYSFFTEKMGHPSPIFAWRSKFSDFLYKADPSKPVRTIKAQGGQYTGPFHWESRSFTADELKRLQTFPDKYQLTGSRGQVIKQLGNSVPPQFARILALSVLAQVFNYSIPVPLEFIAPTEDLSFRKRRNGLTAQYKNKARTAVGHLNSSCSGRVVSGSFRFSIDKKFRYSLSDTGEFCVVVREQDDELFIDLYNNSTAVDENIFFQINVFPRYEWILNYSTIRLRTHVKGVRSYTALWKTFDYLLARDNIKADLVQLCGYYQYLPAFNQELLVFQDSFEEKDMQHFLQYICFGDIVGKILSLHDLSMKTVLSENTILHLLSRLKEIGYEVRSSGTNISLNNDSYLIPYSFPTLTPSSVQLSKRL